MLESGLTHPAELMSPQRSLSVNDDDKLDDMSWSSGDESSFYESDDSSSEYSESGHMEFDEGFHKATEDTVPCLPSIAPAMTRAIPSTRGISRCGSAPLTNMVQNMPNSLLERMRKADAVGLPNASFRRNSPMDHSYHPSTSRVTLKRTQPKRPACTNPAMPRSDSAPLMTNMLQNAPESLLQRMRKADSVVAIPMQRNAQMSLKSPQDHFESILKSQGVNTKQSSAMELENFFVKMTEENIKAYTLAKTVAIRNDDMETLKDMHRNGEILQCSNQFGETILHTGCRRGSLACVRFLLQEVAVDPKVIDDYGRTVFHDICWTTKPVFELVEILLTICPDLLWITDKRGFTPLTYVPKDCWSEWCDFLDKQADKLVPRQLHKP